MAKGEPIAGSILVVDDDPTFCTIMREMLRRQGFNVEIAYSVAEARQRLSERVPDLILTDIMMPEVDGLSLVRTMRQEPQWAHIPLVVVSARVMESDREAARAAGADEFVSKPFTMKRLTTTIHQFLPAV